MRLTWRHATAASAAGALSMMVAGGAQAADHRDGPGTIAEPAADINDVYAWTETGKLVLAMTVFPVAPNDAQFSPEVQYVFHVERGGAFGAADTSTDIICTFGLDQKASCWVGTADYVTGDAAAPEGLVSASGDTRVFTGLRADPFFFNLEGFLDTVSAVKAAASSLTFDAAGCPALDAATATTLQGLLKSTQGGAGAAADFFLDLNTLSIVLEIDPSLIAGQGDFVSVWASTHSAT